RRDAGVVHETDAARSGARLQLRLSASAQEEMATVFRTHVSRRNTEYLPAASVQPQLRCSSRRLVRAESSGRRFRRNVCRLAHAWARLAQRLCWVAGTTKTGIRR